MSKNKPVEIKTTLKPTKVFFGRFRAKKDVKHLKAGDEINLHVIYFYLEASKIQLFNENSEKVPLMVAIADTEFSDYFTEIL